MKLKITILFLLSFFILGCSQKNSTVPTATKTIEIAVDTHTQTDIQAGSEDNFEDDDFEDDDFEDDFEEEESNFDPLYAYNLLMTHANDKIFTNVLNPISAVYASIMPEQGRIGISNFFTNIEFPLRFVNNILQFKFNNAMDETKRFLINSTLGLGGIMDVAQDAYGIQPHKEDFGQTLGYYGIGSGFPIVLPLLGQSNLRDTLSLSADFYFSPISYTSIYQKYTLAGNVKSATGLYLGYLFNKTSLHLGEYESIKSDALNLYTFFRDTYEQKRENDIND